MEIKEFEQSLHNFLKALENNGGTVDFLFGAETMANYAVNLLMIHEIVEDSIEEAYENKIDCK